MYRMEYHFVSGLYWVEISGEYYGVLVNFGLLSELLVFPYFYYCFGFQGFSPAANTEYFLIFLDCPFCLLIILQPV